MKKFMFISVILLIWVNIAAAATIGNSVEVTIINDNGRELPFYPVKMNRELKKVYAEAFKGDHYRIVVRNKLNRRVGVVIAVDGRNIISGQKSWLKNTERMYIIDAYSTNEFSGWRSGQDKINRFYFTDVPDSYAAAFGDESAMGVIAVAAYPEVRRYEPPINYSYTDQAKKMKEPSRDKAMAPSVQGRSEALESAGTGYGRDKAMAPSVQGRSEALESAGTGYGEEEYSPSYRVEFEPEKKAIESILIKYEWRKTLCHMNIINCGVAFEYSHNRIWENDGYAPAPPCRH